MRSVWLARHGGPEVLEVCERPEPVRRPGDALIAVKACGLNHLDIWVRLGGARGFPLPLIPGTDAAGVVIEAPEGSSLSPGTEVVVYPAEGCGACPACETGNDPLCRAFRIYGAWRDGGLAERMAVPVWNCVPKPPELDFVQAASVSVNYITAWHMLVARAQLRAGETILVHAAGSGVSTAAIQIARFLGARIAATSSTPEKLEHARRQGAEIAIDYRSEDVAARVLEWTGGSGADVVLDHVGAPNFERSLKCLAKGGRFVTCGVTGGGEVKLDLSPLYFKGQSVLGSTMGTRGELRAILGLMGRGYFRPHVDKVFALEEIAEAHRYLESGRQTGKVVVRM